MSSPWRVPRSSPFPSGFAGRIGVMVAISCSRSCLASATKARAYPRASSPLSGGKPVRTPASRSNRLQPAGNLNRSVALLEDLDGAAIRHGDEERNAVAVSREFQDPDSQSPQFIPFGKHTLLGS